MTAVHPTAAKRRNRSMGPPLRPARPHAVRAVPPPRDEQPSIACTRGPSGTSPVPRVTVTSYTASPRGMRRACMGHARKTGPDALAARGGGAGGCVGGAHRVARRARGRLAGHRRAARGARGAEHAVAARRAARLGGRQRRHGTRQAHCSRRTCSTFSGTWAFGRTTTRGSVTSSTRCSSTRTRTGASRCAPASEARTLCDGGPCCATRTRSPTSWRGSAASDDPRVLRALATAESDLVETAQGLAWPCRPRATAPWRGPGRASDSVRRSRSRLSARSRG